MDTTTITAAQDQLISDIEALIDTFRTDYTDITLQHLHYNQHVMEGDSKVGCSIAFKDEQGAQITRSI